MGMSSPSSAPRHPVSTPAEIRLKPAAKALPLLRREIAAEVHVVEMRQRVQRGERAVDDRVEALEAAGMHQRDVQVRFARQVAHRHRQPQLRRERRRVCGAVPNRTAAAPAGRHLEGVRQQQLERWEAVVPAELAPTLQLLAVRVPVETLLRDGRVAKFCHCWQHRGDDERVRRPSEAGDGTTAQTSWHGAREP